MESLIGIKNVQTCIGMITVVAIVKSGISFDHEVRFQRPGSNEWESVPGDGVQDIRKASDYASEYLESESGIYYLGIGMLCSRPGKEPFF